MSRERSLLSRVLVATSAFIAPLILAEVGLRLGRYEPFGGSAAPGERSFVLRPSAVPGLVYEPTPGAQGRVWKSDVSINSSGFRDRERALEKRPGVTRVIALGDSITFGNHLDVDSTWPAVLEQRCLDQGAAVEVLNLGVGGYDTAQEVLFLESVGLAFQPDFVIVAVCVNDVATVSLNLEEFERARALQSGWTRFSRLAQWLSVTLGRRSLQEEMEQQRARDVEGSVAPEADAAIREGVATVRGVVERSVRTADVLAPEQVGLQILEWYTEPARIARIRRSFERLARLGEENGFELVVCVVPFLEDEGEELQGPAWRAAYAMIEHEATRLGFRFVELYEAFRSAGIEELRRRPMDPIHPGRAGHRLIAEALLPVTAGELGAGN